MLEQWDEHAKTRRPRQPAQPPTAAQQRLQRQHAKRLCENAATDAARLIADKLARLWLGCGCADLVQTTPPATRRDPNMRLEGELDHYQEHCAGYE